MKKIILMSFMCVSLLGFNSNAKAGLLLEPHFGMILNGTIESGSVDGTITGNPYGVKLGYKMVGFNFGFNYTTGTVTSEYDCSFPSCDKSDGDLTQYGVFVGYDFPILFRVWFEHVLASTKIGSDDGDATGTSGSTIGFGYKILPMVSLNFTMNNLSFSEDEDGDEIELDSSFYTLGVSFPLNL